MKSIFKFSALALLATLFTVSCEREMINPEEDLVPGKERTFTLTFAQPSTKVSIGEGENLGKTAWEAGDEVFIHTGHIREGEYTTVTLKAEDISADGKKATITIPELKTYDWVANGWTENAEDYSLYYASYPASAQANPSSCYSRSYFKNTNQPLMAGYAVGEDFIFFNVTGIITFKVTGDFDSYVFYGNKEETVGYETYAVELLPKGNDFMYKGTANPMTTIKGDIKAGATNYICLPNGTDFEAGFTIVLKKGDKFVKMASTEKPVNVVRSGILDLGEITEKLVDYVEPEHHNSIENATDLSDVQANCFVISAAGAYKFPAVKGEGTETVGEVKGVELLWETCNAKDAVEKNSVIAKVDYEDNWIYFQTSEDLLAGNALIAAKDANDKVLWSWHIWIPSTAFTVGTFGLSSVPMMSRNLGALVDADAAAVDARSAGLYYQWGRKDPFVGYKWGSSSYDVAVAGKSGRSMSKSTTQITLAEAIAAPTTLVTFKGDWLPERDNTLWGAGADKTIYDPCPAGYRVPEYNTEDPLWQKVVALEGFEADGTAGYWKVGEAVFNMTGFYDYDGNMSHPYDRSFYWSNLNNSSEEYGQCQYVYYENEWKSEPGWGKRKACALPVRCVVADASAVVEPAKDGDILWAEDWTGATDKMDMTTYAFTGTTVYGGGTVEYTFVNGDSTTYTYVDNNMNGTDSQPNLLLSKKGGKWTIEGIPAAGATVATLTFNVNNSSSLNTKVALSSSTEGVTIGDLEVSGDAKPFTVKYAITLSDVKKFDLEFSNTNSANIRIDDVKLVAGAGSEPEQPKEPAYEHVWGWYSAGDGSTLWTANVTAISVTHPDGYGMVRGLAMDDEYIYLPKSSAYAAVAAVKITDPTTQVAGNVTGIAGGSTFVTSFPRVIKNTDANVNGGKDVLLVCNLTATDSDANKLVVYAYTNGIEAAPVVLCAFCWDSANSVNDWRRYGDRFFVTGTWQEGKLWFPSFHANKIVCLSVADGARTAVTQYAAGADNSPEGIKDITVWEGTDTQYLITNNSVGNLLAPAEGTTNGWNNLVLNFATEKAVGTWGYNFFKFNDKDYVAYAKLDGKKAWIEVKEQQVNLGRTIEYPTVLFQIPIHSAASLDSELTTGGLADCAVRVIDGVPYIAALTRDGAMTVYKLVLK